MLVEEIHTSMTEAKSNIEYLQVIKVPCEEMKLLSPKEIPMVLMRILNLFRYIWLNSPYYNTEDKITLLCRGLSNQIILQCTEYLNMDLIFKSKRTRESIHMFQICIDCCNRYIQIYTLVSKSSKETNKSNVNISLRFPIRTPKKVPNRGNWRKLQFSITSIRTFSAVKI